MRELLLSRNKDARAISMVCGAPRASSFPSSDRRERRDQTVRCWRGKRGAEQARCVRAQAKRVITYGAIKNEESYTLELTEENVETVLDEVKRKKKKNVSIFLLLWLPAAPTVFSFFLSFQAGFFGRKYLIPALTPWTLLLALTPRRNLGPSIFDGRRRERGTCGDRWPNSETETYGELLFLQKAFCLVPTTTYRPDC